MPLLKKAFRTPAINLGGWVNIFSGDPPPDQVDDGSIPVGSLYLRVTGEAFLKTGMPTIWKKLLLESNP